MPDENKPKGRGRKGKSPIALVKSVDGQKDSENHPNAPKDEDKPDKLSIALIESHLVDWMEGKKLLPYAPKAAAFNNHFWVYRGEEEDQIPQILRFNPKTRTLSICPNETALASVIRKSFDSFPQEGQIYRVSYAQALKVALCWRDDTERVLKTWPEAIAFKSDPDMAFNRLPFDPDFNYDVETSFPILKKIFGRITNNETFRAFVGSWFEENGSRIQMLYLYGIAGSGKSALLNILAKLCGGPSAVARKGKDGTYGKHWKKPLLKKKLVIFNEADPDFLSKKEFLALTGEDFHEIEPKGKDAYTARLDCRAVFVSNDPPTIPNKEEIKRRLLVCEITPFDVEDRKDERELNALTDPELPAFIAYCIDTFRKVNIKGLIPCPDMSLLDEAIGEHNEFLQAIFDECFELVGPKDKDPFPFIAANEFQKAIRPFIDPKKGVSEVKFRKFVKDNFNIQSKKDRRLTPESPEEKKQGRYYLGLKLKTRVIQVSGEIPLSSDI